MSFPNEQIFNSFVDLKYIFQKGYTPYLVVVFSGFSPIESPPLYNYVNTLSNINCSKLFILDDQCTQGCYYLGYNKTFNVEKSVIHLISYICQNNNIQHDHIITAGSSKGGYSALYYGLKYNFKYIISGAPQIFIGNYMLDQYKYLSYIAEFISGGIDENAKAYLNYLIFNAADQNKNILSTIYLHVGINDDHYEYHVKPFLKFLDAKGIKYNLDLQSYSVHNELAIYFPPYLINTLNLILNTV